MGKQNPTKVRMIRSSSILLVGFTLLILAIVIICIVVKQTLFKDAHTFSEKEPSASGNEINISLPGEEEDLEFLSTSIAGLNETDITAGLPQNDGMFYDYNDHLSNYLFLGLDKRDFVSTEKGSADAGQTDAIYLISIDRVTNETSLISIPRDCMTKIRKYVVGGESFFFVPDHLSTAYGYGDGKHLSCALTREAVSNMLGQIPISGYCVISLDALETMALDVDGIKVTVPDDSLTFADENMQPGAEMTLDPGNIETFLRIRDITEDNTAIYRMQRQQLFLKAFMNRAGEKYCEDSSYLSHLFVDLKQHMLTNMSTDEFVKVMMGLTGGNLVNEWTIPGEAVTTSTYDEYHLDREALYKKLLETFCKRVA